MVEQLYPRAAPGPWSSPIDLNALFGLEILAFESKENIAKAGTYGHHLSLRN
jgi:hypothetical protein